VKVHVCLTVVSTEQVFELVKNAMRATVEHHRKLTKNAPGKVNHLKQVMNPESPSLGFFLPSVRYSVPNWCYRPQPYRLPVLC
jgi:hypothetical protein